MKGTLKNREESQRDRDRWRIDGDDGKLYCYWGQKGEKPWMASGVRVAFDPEPDGTTREIAALGHDDLPTQL